MSAATVLGAEAAQQQSWQAWLFGVAIGLARSSFLLLGPDTQAGYNE